MIHLEVMRIVEGHSNMYVEDVESEKRAELAATVDILIKKGHFVFLIQGEEARRIQGYDAESNEWIVLATAQLKPNTTPTEEVVVEEGTGKKRRGRKPKTERIPAAGTRATAVAATAGG